MTVTDPAADLRPLNTVMPARQYLAAMWSRRDFAVALPFEEVRATHQDTLLGNLWHLANPMLSVAVYYLVFGVMLDVSRGVDNYILFLMIGVFTFNLTLAIACSAGRPSISSNQGLMRSIRFPRALLPFSVVLSRAVHVQLRVGRPRRRRCGDRRRDRPALVVAPRHRAVAFRAQPRRCLRRRSPQRQLP